MTFLHMHHAMANKASALLAAEAKTDREFWRPNTARLRDIVLSGAADYKSKWLPETVTDEDRKIVLRYLGALS